MSDDSTGTISAEIKAELTDAFQFTNADGRRHGYVTREWVESLLIRHATAVASSERDSIRNLGVNPLTGRCAYEAFATATHERLNLPAWDAIPPEARVDWQMTADAVLMLATLKHNPEDR
jgi:hypothetical protein